MNRNKPQRPRNYIASAEAWRQHEAAMLLAFVSRWLVRSAS